MLLKYKY